MPDGIKFSELESTLTLGNNDLAAVSHDNGDSTYTSVKVPMTQLGQKVVNDIDYTQALNTTNKKPIGAINELKEELLNIYPVLTTSPAPIANFTTDLALPLKSCKVEIKPKQASGTPSPSNPLPISGTDTIIVTQTGANLWDEEWELGSISTTTGQPVSSPAKIRSKNFIPIKASTSFCIMTESALADTDYIYFYDINQNFISSVVWKSSQTGLRTFVFTSPSNAYYMKFVNKGTTYNNDISINYPSTDTQYHAHVAATTKTVTLPETIYFGEIDLTGGDGTKQGKITFDGSQANNQFSFASFESQNRIAWNGFQTLGKVGAKDFYSNKLKTASGYISTPDEWEVSNSSASVARCFIGVPLTITSVADWQAYVTNNPIELYYELATPTPITLANPIDLTAKAGVNNVFGDTDGNTSVEFRESVQKYVDDNIAAVQALIL